MKLGRERTIMIGTGLAFLLLAGCGSGTDDKSATQGSASQEDNSSVGEGEDNQNDENNISVGYESRSGVLVETKADGTKLAWVNTRGTECLIYRLADHPGTTIVGGGGTHCEGLNFAGISTWRMPTESEAVYLMAHANENETRLIYPDDNPTCLFMATDTTDHFVYTTNHANVGAFTDTSRGTAGIRCVAIQ